MKIIVRAPNWLGDVVLSFPALESLKRNLPQAQMWIAAREEVQDLYSSFDFVKGIVPLPGLNNLRNLRETSKKIKEYDFDIGLLLTNSFSSALLFFLAQIPQRWGYSRDNRGLLLTKGVPFKDLDGPTHHQVHYYLNLISGLGFQTSAPELALPLSPQEKNWVENELSASGYDQKKPLIILNPGAYYGPAKRWPAHRFAELASMLQEKHNAQILVIGSAEEVELVESIASSMTERPINMAGKTTLLQLAKLISLGDLFITNDSGPMHIANALRVPLVAIFGPTDPRVTGPFHQPSAVIKKEVPCWPCSYRTCPFDHRCMTEIKPEEIFALSQKFL